ncbi:MAG: BON domain-containing protein [Gammaproteobacteria bacterium]
MKALMSPAAALALVAAGAVWAGETGETEGSQAGLTEQSSQGNEMPQTKGPESERSSTLQDLNDVIITSKVRAALAQDPSASALAIAVESTKGKVRLSGSVDSVDEKMKAESIARRVDGVKEVENRLAVK